MAHALARDAVHAPLQADVVRAALPGHEVLEVRSAADDRAEYLQRPDLGRRLAEGTELPDAEKVPMRTDTIFDLASVSKLFTSIAVMQLAESGDVDVDAPAATHLPEFGVNGKESIRSVRNGA